MDPELPEKQEDILSILEEQFPNLPPRDDIISVLQETQLSAQGEWLSQLPWLPGGVTWLRSVTRRSI